MGVVFKKERASFNFILTFSSVIFLWLFGVDVFALFIYTIYISIISVSQEEPSLKHLINRYVNFANQQFLRRKDIVESKFLIAVNYSV